MKRYKTLFLLVIIFVLAPEMIWGQERNMNWYFGNNAGISFQSIPPISTNSNTMNTEEGTASMSDTVGQLLFYCDTSVWNRAHQPMLNGEGINSHISSTQACLVLPRPATNYEYVVITTPRFNIPPTDNANYSIIDMTLDGGFGEVVQKNILLMDSSSEKLTATLHENGIDYWVLMHRMGSNAFVSFLLTQTGFSNNPIYSFLGPTYSSTSFSAGDGWLRFSNDGSKVLNAHRRRDQIEIYDFDNATGVLSNRIELSESDPYGAEFSQSDQYIYCTVGTNVSTELIQFDMSSGDSTLIANSRVVLHSESGLSGTDYLKAMAFAPDGKIYVSRVNIDTLGVINSPDQPGLASDYNHSGLPLAFGNCRWGLPNFVKQYAVTPNAIVEVPKPIELGVFPVPARSSVEVAIPNSWQGTALRMELFDQRGSLLRNAEITFSKQLVIERNDLESGVYQGAIYANRELAGVFRVVFE